MCGSITTPAMELVPCEKGGIASQTIGTEPKRRPTWAGLRLYLTSWRDTIVATNSQTFITLREMATKSNSSCDDTT